jgi:hypothetical protein
VSIAISARECHRGCDRSKIDTRVGAHGASSGQVFECIVRDTWRIAAFEKQPELESRATTALGCMASLFSYDCDQRRSAPSGKPEAFALRAKTGRVGPVKQLILKAICGPTPTHHE